uniref:Ribosomal protein n=1 Tax=Gastroclonium compressum TaxID=1852973 RepID=A0A173G094_GASCM|nr:50S ribosomal protein L1 [Coeloseira compressa]ANH09701.1 50S ribosomal protein L1 [Coeloseira compressa]
MKKHSRRFQLILEQLDQTKFYTPLNAIQLLKQLSNLKFVETIEAHIVLNLDPKYADQQLRATAFLPKGTGKKVRVAVIAKSDKLSEALQAGADIVGSEDLVNQIANGFLDFDKLIATPDMMIMIAKLGRVLGPRGLMPSPKAGTITNDLSDTIQAFKAGKLEYRIDRTGILHLPFGKLSFFADDLLSNFKALQDSINKYKPAGCKGKYWKAVYFSSTMGPSISIDLNSIKEITA